MNIPDHHQEHLWHLEQKSLYILREAYNRFPKLAMLWSMGKDSTLMLWLARKAFFGHIPFPLIHIDTTYKIPEMITFRDQLAKDWNLKLLISKNTDALNNGMNSNLGRLECCNALKTEALQKFLEKNHFQSLLVAIRRDEEGSRAKERYFSPRDQRFQWDYVEQPPELWDQYNTSFPKETHVRIHPILHWSELDIWLYPQQEKIPTLSLYYAHNGLRFRSVGCAPCTAPIQSEADTIEKIIEELKHTQISERSGRAQDKADTYAMEKLRLKGYM